MRVGGGVEQVTPEGLGTHPGRLDDPVDGHGQREDGGEGEERAGESDTRRPDESPPEPRPEQKRDDDPTREEQQDTGPREGVDRPPDDIARVVAPHGDSSPLWGGVTVWGESEKWVRIGRGGWGGSRRGRPPRPAGEPHRERGEPTTTPGNSASHPLRAACIPAWNLVVTPSLSSNALIRRRAVCTCTSSCRAIASSFSPPASNASSARSASLGASDAPPSGMAASQTTSKKGLSTLSSSPSCTTSACDAGSAVGDGGTSAVRPSAIMSFVGTVLVTRTASPSSTSSLMAAMRPGRSRASWAMTRRNWTPRAMACPTSESAAELKGSQGWSGAGGATCA